MKLSDLLLGGEIISPKSGVRISNIHTVEIRNGNLVIGGYTVVKTLQNKGYDVLADTLVERWTTIKDIEL